MDKKILAIVAVIIIVVAAVGVYFVTQNGGSDNEDDYSIIARVNTEGSGIFLNEGENPDDYITIQATAPTDGSPYLGEEDRYVVFNKEAWGGKIFADPGTATIQHVQLQQIAQTMGLNFQMYSVGTTLNSNTLYYVPNVGTYATYELQRDANNFTGGFIWEAQYSIAVKNGCVGLVTTNDMFPDHTCCVVGASNNYMESHTSETVRFLAAYMESVNRMQAAIQAGSGSDFDTLMSVAIDKVSMPEDMSDDAKRSAILEALGIVTYTYCDDATAADPLAQLKVDIADLVEQFQANGNLDDGVTYSSLGFDSAQDLANAFVQSQYIKDAIDGNYEVPEGTTSNITVAVITGDIHQLAIHYGIELGIFAEYGLNVTTLSQTNGPGVYSALSNGTAQFGFIGAPPMTTNSMNNDAIAA